MFLLVAENHISENKSVIANDIEKNILLHCVVAYVVKKCGGPTSDFVPRCKALRTPHIVVVM